MPDTSTNSNVPGKHVNPPGRCGDTGMIEIRAYGHNFYGAGFGDWEHQRPNSGSGRANGTGYEGISFWARSPGNIDKTFMFYVDDGTDLRQSHPVARRGPSARSHSRVMKGNKIWMATDSSAPGILPVAPNADYPRSRRSAIPLATTVGSFPLGPRHACQLRTNVATNSIPT